MKGGLKMRGIAEILIISLFTILPLLWLQRSVAETLVCLASFLACVGLLFVQISGRALIRVLCNVAIVMLFRVLLEQAMALVDLGNATEPFVFMHLTEYMFISMLGLVLAIDASRRLQAAWTFAAAGAAVQFLFGVMLLVLAMDEAHLQFHDRSSKGQKDVSQDAIFNA